MQLLVNRGENNLANMLCSQDFIQHINTNSEAVHDMRPMKLHVLHVETIHQLLRPLCHMFLPCCHLRLPCEATQVVDSPGEAEQEAPMILLENDEFSMMLCC